MQKVIEHSAVAGERLTTPVREFMRPGAITMAAGASLLEAKRAMVRHGVHAVLILADGDGRALGWVSAGGLLGWLERDLSALPAAEAITEPAHRIDPDALARDALDALRSPGVTHLVVASPASEMPHGVVSAMDLVDLLTRP